MPDYRELIEQVQNRGGPLEVYDTMSGPAVGHKTDSPDHPAAWLLDDLGTVAMDAICGVLRHDMHRRGIQFVRVETQMDLHSQPSEGPHVVSWLHHTGDDAPGGGVHGEEPILALMLRAWLEAVPEDKNASAR